MSFFKKLGKGLYSAVKVLAPVVIVVAKPGTVAYVIAGLIIKHGTPISNKAIPYLNLGISSALSYAQNVRTTGDWSGAILPALQTGALMAGMSTALHQSIKQPTQNTIQIKGHSL